ncbi:hypothetical protein HAQ04_26750 [Pseudomonas sp. C2L11]|nr:hypothetical protein [Pseudomonas typographi]
MSRPAGDMHPVDDWVFGQLVEHARPADRQEFEAVNGFTLEIELRRALDLSENPRAFVVDGRVVAAFGCVRFDDRIGVPWMISTYAVNQHRRAFLRQCLVEVAAMRKRHAALINYTDARYTLALRWMLWMGFDQQEAIPYGVNGELFHPFTMKGELWAQ